MSKQIAGLSEPIFQDTKTNLVMEHLLWNAFVLVCIQHNRETYTVQITFIFIGQTRLVFGNCVCTCVTKHISNFSELA